MLGIKSKTLHQGVCGVTSIKKKIETSQVERIPPTITSLTANTVNSA